MLTRQWQTHIDSEGRVALPPEAAACYGMKPGDKIQILEGPNGLQVRQPLTHLAKLYVEPTDACNLECRTCIRNTWDAPLGRMTSDTWQHLVHGLRAFPPPTVFFGGWGEPLAHSHIVEMVAQAKSAGASIELITNGTLLTPDMSRRLIAAGLDILWVSLDGATPESYADVRLAAALPQILSNVEHFRDARPAGHRSGPAIGVAFVAMKRNIAELPQVLNLGRQLGASRFMITNVLPYTPELRREMLYTRALDQASCAPSPWAPHIRLPKMDVNEDTREPLYWMMHDQYTLNFAGTTSIPVSNQCPFIINGAAAVGWEGNLAPCLPLLHNHISYLNERSRFSRCYSVGNVAERSLSELWHSAEYVAFRERVWAFDFPSCLYCWGCDQMYANEEDCLRNVFPTCGSCLWAQGVIQCP